jgi:natural product precursor
MKKLSLEILTSDEVLQRSQMKKITGGYGYTCFCGNFTNPTSGSFHVWAGNNIDALDTAHAQCGSHSVSCG